MSKLSKFKHFIDMHEASNLLESLIGEPVDVDALEQMYKDGWLRAMYVEPSTIHRLIPTDDTGENFQIWGNDGAGKTQAVYMPCKIVNIPILGRAFTMVDGEGSYYSIRDNKYLEIQGPDWEYNPIFQDLFVSPEEIYRLADIANSKSIPDDGEYNRPIENVFASFPDVQSFYNIRHDRATSVQAPVQITEEKDPPSYRKALGILLRMLEEPRLTPRNQSGIVSEILARYPGVRGLGKTSLENAFSAANKALDEAGLP